HMVLGRCMSRSWGFLFPLFLPLFFFSSRRRHTRFSRDWSSDVCSSDLGAQGHFAPAFPEIGGAIQVAAQAIDQQRVVASGAQGRSEERRVGKESETQEHPIGQEKK